MNPAQVEAVKDSFARVRPASDQVGAMFYDRLFTLDPKLRPLFKGDLASQSRKLMTTLALVVDGLDRLEELIPAVQGLGARHATYGVTDADYNTVAQALLWTLEQGLGDEFTPATREAWTNAYTVLAATMKEAAHSPVAG